MTRALAVLSVLALIAAAVPWAGVRAQAPAPGVRIVRKSPAFDLLVAKDAVVEKLADGYSWTEGPLWDNAADAFSSPTSPATTSSRGRRVRAPPSS